MFKLALHFCLRLHSNNVFIYASLCHCFFSRSIIKIILLYSPVWIDFNQFVGVSSCDYCVLVVIWQLKTKNHGRWFDRRLSQLNCNPVTVLCETSHQNCPFSVAVVRPSCKYSLEPLHIDFYQWLLPVALVVIFGLDSKTIVTDKAESVNEFVHSPAWERAAYRTRYLQREL